MLFSRSASKPYVVQMLGDIDDQVSEADDKDLRASRSQDFTWIKVRGTGHDDIIDFHDPSTESGSTTLGSYRRNKFLLATTGSLSDVRRENEEQPYETDDKVTHVVFILHGIRDLGRWSAEFEAELLERFRKQTGLADDKLVVASLRYGYFGMGPFLLRPDRQKYVRWFMDGYTETLARYPKVKQIHFVGHSNGTYLLASALERYKSLRVDHIVFGGSVVRTDFDWDTAFKRHQFSKVRNYVASDDWVVALFPRFFEQRPMRWLGNDLGSAGFNGFDSFQVENVKYVLGGHDAFLKRPEIVDFLLPGESRGAAKTTDADPNILLKWTSDWACWAL